MSNDVKKKWVAVRLNADHEYDNLIVTDRAHLVAIWLKSGYEVYEFPEMRIRVREITVEQRDSE